MAELIAHRAGNTAAALATVPPGTHAVELDVHRHQGRLVVRHAKRVWGTRRLWERWYLLAPGTVVPELAPMLQLVAEAGLDLWIDLKGVSPRLVDQLLPALAPSAADATTGPVTISTKSWWLLGRVATGVSSGERVRLVRSAGNRVELVLLRFWPSTVALDGVVVHRRLLTASQVDRLRRRHGRVFTWSVPDLDTAHRLMAWGIDGLIIDDAALLRTLAGAEQP